MSKGKALKNFTESAEFATKTETKVNVLLDIIGLLNQAPDKTTFDYWYAKLDAGMSDTQLVGAIMQSSDYHIRFMG